MAIGWSGAYLELAGSELVYRQGLIVGCYELYIRCYGLVMSCCKRGRHEAVVN